MQKNTLKARLREGETVLGTELTDCLSIEVSQLLFEAGFDFFFVDTEHGVAGYERIQNLCRAGRSAGVTPIVRVTDNEYFLIARTLDVGATGIIVPRISSAEVAWAVLESMKFSPEGRRGFGLRGIITDFQPMDVAEAMESANRETLAVLQIETKEGLECVEDIALTPGVDVLLIGPVDLSISLGIPGRFESALFWEAFERTLSACRRANIAVGIAFADMGLLVECAKRGARFLSYGNDMTVLLKGYKEAAAIKKLASR